MSKSGYHVTLSVFVPFDPRNPKTVAKQAKALEHLTEGNILDATQLGELDSAVVKKVAFMQTVPKHMTEAVEVAEAAAKKAAEAAAKKKK